MFRAETDGTQHGAGASFVSVFAALLFAVGRFSALHARGASLFKEKLRV